MPGRSRKILVGAGRVGGVLSRRAARLRLLAGHALGLKGPRLVGRRGSVLVLILGAIAMLAVVTVAYVTVGQTDRRTGAIVAARDRTGDTIQEVADYLARIIGDDALSVWFDGTDLQVPNTLNPGDPGPVLVREAWDAPSIDPLLMSVPPAGRPDLRFNPVGSYDSVFAGNGPDPRFATDPWLSSSEPSWLEGDFDPNPPSTADLEYLEKRDWAIITNPAPSGNPVNLFNLRNNFDAAPGFSPNPFAPPAGQARMSDRLSLFEDDGTVVTGAPTTWYGYTLTANDARVPFFWTAHQRAAFRPAKEVNYGPQDQRYMHYQWADADGDGMLDSRWFELVDVTDPQNPISILTRDDRYRWFVASRIIDLSGLININAAAEFRTQPSNPSRNGVTPADIDLRRVLRLVDPYLQWQNTTGTLIGYEAIERAQNGPYLGYNKDIALSVGHWADYALRLAMRDGSVPWPGAELDGGEPSFVFNNSIPLSAAQRARQYRRVGAQPLGAAFTNDPTTPAALPMIRVTGGAFGLPDLLELLTYWGVNDPATVSRLELALGGRYSQLNGGGALVDESRSPLRDNRTLTDERGGHDNAENGGAGNGLPDDDAMTLAAFDVRRLLTTVSQSRLFRSSILLPFLPAIPGAPDYRQKLDALADQRIDAREALEAASTDQANTPAIDERDPRLLFAAYCDALLPHSWRLDSASGQSLWNRVTSTQTRYGPMFYGNDPVIALWCAAHMTANAIDMYDKPALAGTPDEGRDISAFTLAISGAANDLDAIDQSMSDIPPPYPYWKTRQQSFPQGNTPPQFSGTLDLDRALDLRTTNQGPTQQSPYPSRMARQNDLSAGGTPVPPAMNIYGIEKQPFITQVATFVLYTDCPDNAPAGGDDENQGLAPPSLEPITIDGSRAQANSDYIGQIIAFQITNPFDDDVTLTGEYYLEFAGNYFRFTNVDAPGNPVRLERRDSQNSTVALQRQNTRVFYVMNDSVTSMETRLAARMLPFLLPPAGDGPMRDIVEKQLTMVFGANNTIEPIQIERFDPVNGTAPTGFEDDLLADNPTGAFHDTVRLWRRARAPGSSPNDTWDDILVDRLRDPTVDQTVTPQGGDPHPPTVLVRRLPDTNDTVTGTEAGPDPSNTGEIPNAVDNTGFSICYVGTVKRGDDPGGMTTIPLGCLPAYCLEAHPDATGNLQNYETPQAFQVPSLDRNEFTNSSLGHVGSTFLYNAATSPSLHREMTTAAAIPSIAQVPEDKNGDNSHFSLTPPYDERYPEVYVDDREFRSGTTGPSVLRVSDMLLPLCVGPTHVPDPNLTRDKQWLTFGEAVALAMGQADMPSTQPAFGFLSALGNDPPGPADKTDRANLALDRFIPHEKISTATAFDPTVDQRHAPGVPLAATVLDIFKTTDPDVSSITRGVPGLVNLNTALSRVLKALPLLAPNPASTNGVRDYLWGFNNPQLPQPPDPTIPGGSDYAATLEAYRDTARVSALDQRPVTFQPTNTALPTLPDALTWNGRAASITAQTIPGVIPTALREAPGFASLGEVLMAKQDPNQGDQRVPLEHRLDRLADDTVNSGDQGVNSTLYRQDANPAPPDPTRINNIEDEYGEQLLIPAGLANLATTRSDTFACWFVIQGYQRSDCENLSNTAGSADPMVPTIAKRYLMVVDRSNVTRLGDKPRILIMQEVPF